MLSINQTAPASVFIQVIMEQYIPFSGLATSPTALDAPDGQFSHIINLIPEDGTLKSLVVGVDEEFRIGSPSSKLLYTHIGNDYCNHIIFDTDPTPGFSYIKDDEVHHPLHDLSHDIPQSFRANTVESIGNILVLMGDDITYYLFWNGSGYDLVGNFDYEVYVTTRTCHTVLDDVRSRIYFDETGNWHRQAVEASLEDNPVTVANQQVSDTESREMYNALVAKLNSLIADTDSKHILRGTCFGVVALQLYDGSYAAISNPFILAPDQRDGLDACTVHTVTDNGVTKITKIYGFLSTAKYKIRVYKQLTDSMRKIVSGAVLFITRPIETWDVDSPNHTGSQTPGSTGDYTFSYERLTADKIRKNIDSLQFFKSISIPADHINDANATGLEVEMVTGAEEHISLADFRRSSFSARVSYVYNNRLHIAGVTEEFPWQYPFVDHILPTYNNSVGDSWTWFLGRDLPTAQTIAQVKVVVHFADGRQIYQQGTTCWPLPPLLSFPDRNATRMEIYAYANNNYYKVDKNLQQSEGFDMAYYLKLDADREFSMFENTDITTITEDIYNDDIATDVQRHNEEHPVARTNNIMRYSEAENPFVFPVTNYVGIGTAGIIGLATSTQPISEGQFGTAPLYVFTEDAIWALTVLDDGTYAPRQPASRDVCINARTITPIDNAVVFATERGIMLISGNTTQCLSEALSGPGEPYTFEPSYQQARAFLALEKEPQNVGGVEQMVDAFTYRDVESPDFRIDFMSRAGIFYDYQNQRLVVFNSSGSGKLAYVYSFLSGLWGAAKTDIKFVTHNYPVPMATFISEYDGDMHAGHAMTHSVYTDPCFFACTRPIKLDAPLSFKTIRAAIVHGRLAYSRIKTALFASNDLDNWTLINTSTNHKLRGKLGNPWRYFRLAFTGVLAEVSGSIDGVHIEYDVRWQNQIR